MDWRLYNIISPGFDQVNSFVPCSYIFPHLKDIFEYFSEIRDTSYKLKLLKEENKMTSGTYWTRSAFLLNSISYILCPLSISHYSSTSWLSFLVCINFLMPALSLICTLLYIYFFLSRFSGFNYVVSMWMVNALSLTLNSFFLHFAKFTIAIGKWINQLKEYEKEFAYRLKLWNDDQKKKTTSK